MDGISRVAGIGGIIQLGDRSLSVRGKVLRHMAEIEAEILRRRGNPFDMIRNGIESLRTNPPDDERSKSYIEALVAMFTAQAFQQAMRWRVVTLDDIDAFLTDTWSGRCMRLWLAVRDNDRGYLTLDRVSEMFADEFESIARKEGKEAAYKWQEQIDLAIDQSDGGDELGNSNSSPKHSEAAVAMESTSETGTEKPQTAASQSPGN
jgi:hypothetical protein